MFYHHASGMTRSHVANMIIKNQLPIVYTTSALKIDVPNLPFVSFDYTLQASTIMKDIKVKAAERRLAEQQHAREKELVEKRKLEEKKKVDLEKRFHFLVNQAEGGIHHERFKNKEVKDVSRDDFEAFSSYISKKIENYKEALKLVEDSEVKKKLEQCLVIEKQIQLKKQRREKMTRMIDKLLS